jgi:YD repeat-containing protein
MGVKGPKNCTFTLNSVNLTAYVDQVDLNMAVAELETTNLDSSAQEFIPGLPSYDASIAVTKWDKVVDDVLGPLALTPAKVTAAIGFTDASGDTVTYTWTSQAFVTGYNLSAQATGKITSGPKVRFSGLPGRVVS